MRQDPADRIIRAVLALGRRLRAERPAGAPSLSTISLLSTLSRAGAMPAARLAAEQRLQPQSLTRIVASLERAGWISRRRSTVDRRELAIALTARGRRVLDAEIRIRRAWLARAIAATLAAGERATLVAAADAMAKLAEHDSGQPARIASRRRASASLTTSSAPVKRGSHARSQRPDARASLTTSSAPAMRGSHARSQRR